VARLIPADFALDDLPKSEQRVCRAFLDGLDDSWSVVPSVPIVDAGKDAEIDVVLASPTHGVVVVEVKGGLIAVKGGTWHQYDKPLKRSPIAQVRNAKHALMNRMRGIGIDLHGLWISHAVAMPDVGAIPAEGLGPDAPREILLGTHELGDPAPAIERIVHERGPVAIDRYTRFLRALRPDIVLEGADSAVMPVATRRIDTDTRGRLEVLHGLDANRRVLVTGGAGTGKTWLVVEWAKRADRRGERTLVLTFNRPLADHLARVLDGTQVTVATYHDMIVQLLTPFGFAIVEHPDRDYWETVPTAALEAHAEHVGTPFDTVIIDEGQDMRPHWLASVERLLDPAGQQRLLMVADPAQSIYVDGFTPPAGSVVMPLEFNLRSARSVAQVVRHLGGPPPLPTAGGRMPVQHRRAGGVKEVRKHVRRAIDDLTGIWGVPLSQIAVLTLRTDVRDQLLDASAELEAGRDPLPLARWEERSEETALCETVHRGKGLERAAVVLIDITDAPEPQLVYIGASRAMWSLTLVGKDVLAKTAGVEPQPVAAS
jgi:hypothetical protein